MDFASRLKELLSDRNISQRDFASKIDIAASTAGNYIRGVREPDYETLKRIAAFFHVSTDYMLGVEQEKANDPLENELLLILRMLDQDQKELLLEQGKLLLKRRQGQR